jgi:hypothetical protein
MSLFPNFQWTRDGPLQKRLRNSQNVNINLNLFEDGHVIYPAHISIQKDHISMATSCPAAQHRAATIRGKSVYTYLELPISLYKTISLSISFYIYLYLDIGPHPYVIHACAKLSIHSNIYISTYIK